jgi:hypothetical protein
MKEEPMTELQAQTSMVTTFRKSFRESVKRAGSVRDLASFS